MKSSLSLSKSLSKLRTFDALRNYRPFRFLLTTNLLYNICWWMMLLVMGWLAYELTDSAFLVAVFTAVRLSPGLLGPVMGVIVDKWDRRKFMIVAYVVQVIAAGVLAILVATGLIEFWHLVVVGFIDGLLLRVCYTAGYALAMDIVGKENISNAIALNTVALDITRVIGPAVGGVLIATLGAANAFWAAAGADVLALIAILPLQSPARAVAKIQESVIQNLVEGFKYVIHNRDMLSVLSISLSANIFIFPAWQAFFPVFAKDNLGLGAQGLSLLMAVNGGGALIGALIIASLGDFKWKGKMLLGGTALTAVFFGAFALAQSFPLALVLTGLAGVGMSGFGVMQGTLMLLLAPEDMRGRAIGFMSFAIGIYTFASLGIGAVANVIGAGLATAISCGILFMTVIAIAIRLPNLRRL